jgi:predicted transcriptional regulator
LSSGFEICEIAIEDDKKRSGEMEVMDVLKFVLDVEFADEDLLPELLRVNKGKLIKDILTLIPRVVACDAKN